MKILVATNFSVRAQRAVRRAGLLAQETNAELRLLHVVESNQPRSQVELDRREAMRHLNEQIAAVGELAGVRCQPWVVVGEASEGIIRAASALNADLIVMGAYRKQLLRSSGASTVGAVIRSGQAPVLMVSGDARRPYRQVLAAVGREASSVSAIKTAAALPFLPRGDFAMLHAYEPIGRNRLASTRLRAAQLSDFLAAERESVKDGLRKFLAARDVDAADLPLAVREGDAVEVITEAVRRDRPDLLVVGTRVRSGFMRALFGSVTASLLHSLDVDILAVPHGARNRLAQFEALSTPIAERLSQTI